MRIMQLYRIENDYKNHKKRLQSIQQLNSKQKVARVTGQQFYVSNQHKKIKINSQIFREKEELTRIAHHNQLMNRTIVNHSSKLKQQIDSSLLGLNNTQKNNVKVDNKIQLENLKLKEKIGKMKSVYQTIRKNSQIGIGTNHFTERQRSRQTDKEKLIKLLKNQFRIQPVVSFPRAKSKTNANETLQVEQQGSKRQGNSIEQNKSQQQI